MLTVSALRPALRRFGLGVFALLAMTPLALLAQSATPTAADGFDPNADGNVYAVAVQKSDGKVLFAGDFTMIQPNGAVTPIVANRIARVNLDGTPDQSFITNASATGGQITAMAVQADNKILIGGKFTMVDSEARTYLARLNADGTLDQSFNPVLAGPANRPAPQVTAILVQQADGKIVIGGDFVGVNGVTRNRIARLNVDGTVDASFDPNASGIVLALAQQADGTLLVGGGFASFQQSDGTIVTRTNFARLLTNGQVDPSFVSPTLDNRVTAIAVQGDGRIVIGGNFTLANTVTRNFLARVNPADGSVDTSFTATATGPISTLVVLSDGALAAGGSFSSLVGPSGGAHGGLGRINADGSIDATFNAFTNASVYAVAEQSDGSLILGGNFVTLTKSTGETVSRNHMARVLANGALDANFNPVANGLVQVVAPQADGKVLIGGSFSNVGGVSRTGLARLNVDGSLDTAFDARIASGQVTAILPLADGTILIGGTFTYIAGTPRNRMAKLKADGTLDTTFDPNFNGQVLSLAVQSDGKILVGGAFTALQPNAADTATSRSYLVRLKPDGSLDDDTAFLAQTDNAVLAILPLANGNIYIGGAFTTVYGTGAKAGSPHYGVARLKPNGQIDEGFAPAIVDATSPTGGQVRALVEMSNGDVVIAGRFGNVGAKNTAGLLVARNNVARLAADGSLNTTYNPNLNGFAASATASADKVVIGGLFTGLTPNGATSQTARNYVVRLDDDGTADTGFDLKIDGRSGNQVASVATQADGKILVAGTFSSLQPSGSETAVMRNRVARVNADGSLDGFDPDVSGQASPTIKALAPQSDGSVFVAGAFENFNGTLGKNFVRLTPEGAPDASFSANVSGGVTPVVNAFTVLPSSASVATQTAGFALLSGAGGLDPSFAPDPADRLMGQINAIAVQSDGKILVGGLFYFGAYGSAQFGLARYNRDGTLDKTFTPAVAGSVYALVLQAGDSMIIGGSFPTVNSTVTRNNVARLTSDGTVDATFDPNLNNVVYTLALTPDATPKLLVGGTFTGATPNGTTTTTVRNYLARFNLDGTLDTGFNPGPNGQVQKIVLQSDGKILVGGGFTGFLPNATTTLTTDNTRSYLARLNADGSIDTSFDANLNGAVATIALQADKIVIGGSFTTVGGTPQAYIARVTSTGALDATFKAIVNGTVLSIAVVGDQIVLGGLFTVVQQNGDETTATARSYIARVNGTDGTLDSTFDPSFNGNVYALAVDSNDALLVGGAFSTVQSNAAVLVGGLFTNVNGAATQNLALLSSHGSINGNFQPMPNGVVNALALYANGRFLAAGDFTQIAGATLNRIARFNADYSLDSSFNPNIDGAVSSLVLQPDGKILVGGSFMNVGGTGHNYLARLNADGTPDSAFNPAVSGPVQSLVLQPDGRILYTAGTPAALQRLNADGSADSSLTVTTGGSIQAVALQADGMIYIGSASLPYLARLSSTGAQDTTFAPQPNGPVSNVVLQRDGKLLIGGSFTKVGDLPRYGLARIAATALGSETITTNSDRTVLTLSVSGASPLAASVLFQKSIDGATWTTLGQASPVASGWQLSGVSLSRVAPVYVRARTIIPTGPNSSSGFVDIPRIFTRDSVGPIIVSATVVNGTSGSPFVYGIAATDQPTSYTASGLPDGLTIDPTTGIISGTPTQTGTFTVTLSATNAAGMGTTTLTLIVAAPGGSTTTAGRLLNVSDRGDVTTENPLIAGLVITGNTPKPVLLRAVGPGLAALGVTNPLPAPLLILFDSDGQELLRTTAWADSATLRAESARLGASSLAIGSNDAAILVTLPPGLYTLQVLSNSGDEGIALAEVYDASEYPPSSTASRLVNLSGRGITADGEKILIGGFVIGGTTSKKVLVRGAGPALSAQGVTGVLTDPVLQVFQGTTLLAQNDNWETPVEVDSAYPAASGADIAAAATATGAFSFSSGSKDSAVILTLAPGSYTAQVKGADGGTGAALIEIYDVP